MKHHIPLREIVVHVPDVGDGIPEKCEQHTADDDCRPCTETEQPFGNEDGGNRADAHEEMQKAV